jgi:hypothetical protein
MNLGYVWNQGEEADGWPRAVFSSVNLFDLRLWMADGWEGTLYADCEWSAGCRWGDYVHTGGDNSGLAACDAPEDTLLYLPVYDAPLHCATEIPDPKPPCPYQGEGHCDHVVGFVGATITSCSQGAHTLTAMVEETVIVGAPPVPNVGFGSDVCALHTMAVMLWEMDA